MSGGAIAPAAEQRAEFLARFRCPDPTGATAPCAHAPQRFGAEFYPRIALPDGSIQSCSSWLQIKCARYYEKYSEWLEIGRDRGIPERYIEGSVNASRRTPALDAVTVFIRGAARRGRALLLIGPTGIGKTWALAAGLHAWPEPRGPEGDPLYLEVSAFIRDLLRWDRAGRRQHPLDAAIEASLLALDDLGVGYIKSDGYAAMAIEELLHHRHAAELPTLMASNWTAKELARRLTARTFDRFREWADIVEVGGPSLRGEDPA